MNAAIYARYSSDMQRQESISAQIRAAKYYAMQAGHDVVAVYTDEAKSGRTADRPGFQRMISDSSKGKFDCVIVHKLDRFSRDSVDALHYERVLNQNGVVLVSVSENLDSTPEGALMKMVITGMNDFYSRNLAREVMKGLKENAYDCRHTGGMLPLGYDINANKKYIINEREAEAVRLIYRLYADGTGYGTIIDTLNAAGYTTKVGRSFGKNSLYEILKNEKYAGVYTYNKSAARSVKGTYNRHRYKDSADIIRIEGGVPAIVSKELFNQVRKKMDSLKKRRGQNKANITYILSGLLVCGECKGSLVGETHRYRDKEYSYYVCARAKRDKTCNQKNFPKAVLEKAVIDNLDKKIFNSKNIRSICEKIYASYRDGEKGHDAIINGYKREILAADVKIKNLLQAIEKGLDHETAADRINALKEEKNYFELKIIELNSVPDANLKTIDELVQAFDGVTISKLSEKRQKELIQGFVSKIFVYRNEDKSIRLRVIINPNRIDLECLSDLNGGEGGI